MIDAQAPASTAVSTVVSTAVNPALRAAVDIGLNNLATLPADQPGFIPRLINGRPAKSITHSYNKRRAEVQSQLGARPRAGAWRASPRSARGGLTTPCTPRFPHTASRTPLPDALIELLGVERIGTLVIGKNPLWKQEAGMGRRTNQTVVSIPHARFVAMLTYKAELVGIHVIVTEESATSKASFLDGDPLPVSDAARPDSPVFSGKRAKRGLYRAANGRHINADVNGAYNILCKVAPDAFGQGSSGCVVHPVRLAA